MSDLSFDGALDALKDAPMEAPDAAPEDNDEAQNHSDDENDDENEDGDPDYDAADTSDADGEENDAPVEASDVDDESEEQAEPALPAIDPPQRLDATQREAFNALPRAAQEILVNADKAMTADYTRKTAEVANKRKEADARLDRLKDVVLSEKEARMQKWAKVDWKNLAATMDPQEFNQNRFQYESEKEEFQKLQTRISGEESLAFKTHVSEQFTALQTLAPELLDGEKGQARRTEIMNAVISAGIPRDRAQWITAVEMAWADKALKWDAYQAEKSKKPVITSSKNAKTTGRALPATSSAATQSSGPRQRIEGNFKSKPSIANARRALDMLPD